MNKLLLPLCVLIITLLTIAFIIATSVPDYETRDYDAIDYGNECRFITTCTPSADIVDNPFK